MVRPVARDNDWLYHENDVDNQGSVAITMATTGRGSTRIYRSTNIGNTAIDGDSTLIRATKNGHPKELRAIVTVMNKSRYKDQTILRDHNGFDVWYIAERDADREIQSILRKIRYPARRSASRLDPEGYFRQLAEQAGASSNRRDQGRGITLSSIPQARMELGTNQATEILRRAILHPACASARRLAEATTSVHDLPAWFHNPVNSGNPIIRQGKEQLRRQTQPRDMNLKLVGGAWTTDWRWNNGL